MWLCLDALQPPLAALFLDQFQQAFSTNWTVGDPACSKIVLKHKLLRHSKSLCTFVKDNDPIDWDITSLTSVLLNIVEFQLSSSVVQAIKDIRSVRNYCSHLPTETISQDKFHELLTKLETGVKQLPEEHEIDFQQILSKSLIKYSGPILPEGGSRFDSHVLAFLSKAIATNQYPKHLAVLVTVTMPSDYDIMFGGAAIFPKVESKPDMLMEEDVLPHHYQSILDLLKLVSSMKENDTTTQRVVILNSCYTTWSYFIFQRITSDGSTNNQIFNMVNSVPVDLFASQARVDTHMQSCIPEYSGTQRDYETIVNYLLSNEVRINPKAHELYREIDNCIAWVSQNRRKGRLINYLITVSGLGNQSRMGGEESMIIALVATGHRLRIKGSNVYSNSFRPNLMIL